MTDGIIYTTTDEGILAIDFETEAIVWKYRAENLISTISNLSVISRILCFVQDNNLVALDSFTGDFRWSYTFEKEISTNPTIWLKGGT